MADNTLPGTVRCLLCGRVLEYNVAYFNRPRLCLGGCRPPWDTATSQPGTGDQVQTTRSKGMTK